MQVDVVAKHELDADSPVSITVASSSPTNGVDNVRPGSNGNTSVTQGGVANGQFPPSKTDKPKPHQCTTCGRSFARLEHLKRHERSHTKEKPFECTECTRCFARRDLLLRHQQKLHLNGAPARPRVGRRESHTGTTIGGNDRVRKNSAVNMAVNGPNLNVSNVRPRANTLSHVDLMQFDPNTLAINMHNGMPMNGYPAPMDFDFNGMPTHMPHPNAFHGLPKLDTHMHNGDTSNTLRTAPPTTNFAGFDTDQIFSSHTTINPAALYAGDAMAVPASMPFGFEANTMQHMPPTEDYGWMRDWNLQHMSGANEGNPEVFEESSPSRISSGDSPQEFNDSMNNSHANFPPDFQWPPAEGPMHSNGAPGAFQLDALGNGFAHLGVMGETASPSHLHPMSASDAYFPQPTMQFNGHPQPHHQMHQQQQHQTQQQPFAYGHFPHVPQYDSNSPSMSSSSLTGSGSTKQSSSSSLSTDSITDSTRQALLNTLSQPSVYGGHLHRKYSQPSVSSPLSAGARPALPAPGPNLPSTADIKRYIEAFIQYAHPHLPVVHYPSLSFESIGTPSKARTASPTNQKHASENAVGGAKCLILSMAAIGALYEYDHPASKELFDASKKMIALYLEEKRKNEMASRQPRLSSAPIQPEAPPPLWLVQAILLNVIYGHHTGEKLAAEVASQHISSLIGLMRAAKVAQSGGGTELSADFAMETIDEDDVGLTRQNTQEAYIHSQWIKWKTQEERKRCFFAMFFVSSLLMIGYNQTPAIMNSEIQLTLPCEEDLYTAESAEAWHNLGGLAAAQQQEIPFAQALGMLLSADSRNKARSPLNPMHQNDGFNQSELKPSTFGCLILISALHNFIWETRSRHNDGEWTPQQMDHMASHLEPALKAWQAAWKSNNHHRIERPNPFGLGPLAADCIPLLDLAFVRLYVNLGPTTEAFWLRDFERMAAELAKENEGMVATKEENGHMLEPPAKAKQTQHPSVLQRQTSYSGQPASSSREQHLRKAAFYAADSLTVACQYNLTYADQTAHELPIQSALCFVDCVQVLAEWFMAVQERVGPTLGVLGRDIVDYSQMPAAMLLEPDDIDLLQKIEDICSRMEQKRLAQENLLAVEINNFNPSSTGIESLRNEVDLTSHGFGARVTRVIAMMLEKAVIWPIAHVMAEALKIEAQHMDRRAQASCRDRM